MAGRLDGEERRPRSDPWTRRWWARELAPFEPQVGEAERDRCLRGCCPSGGRRRAGRERRWDFEHDLAGMVREACELVLESAEAVERFVAFRFEPHGVVLGKLLCLPGADERRVELGKAEAGHRLRMAEPELGDLRDVLRDWVTFPSVLI